MSKLKTVFVCNACGAHSPKWIGKCNSCGAWNSFQEEIIASKPTQNSISNLQILQTAVPLQEIESIAFERIETKIQELNIVLGGGIVPGSVLLLGGEPGIGKSTLLLQVAVSIHKKVLYISGEESVQQISLRAKRLQIQSNNCVVCNETNILSIQQQIKNVDPELIIIDSIQTLRHPEIESAPGSITQIRETANILIDIAKQTHVPILLIGHINKEGSIAGPKILEHMVDVVLQFDGDTHNVYRMLRSLKNRFGSTNEIGIFEMCQTGLREVTNPSEMLLSGNPEQLSGVAIGSAMEGERSFFVEVQALVTTAAFGTPQRTVNGYDNKRLNMLLAVIEKRLGVKIYTKDVFINIAGGIKIQDTALDLAVIAAILSSLFDFYIPSNFCFCGEVGLTGEVRNVSHIEKRIKEASKIGFIKSFVPQADAIKQNNNIVFCSRIDATFKTLFAIK